MKCFYDPTQDAVGTCKSCQRGISHEYLTDMGKGIACKGRCEEDAAALIALIDRNMAASEASNQILRRSSATGYGSGVFMIVMGIFFAARGYNSVELGFTFYMGAIFVAYGVWTLVRMSRYAKIVAKLPKIESEKI